VGCGRMSGCGRGAGRGRVGERIANGGGSKWPTVDTGLGSRSVHHFMSLRGAHRVSVQVRTGLVATRNVLRGAGQRGLDNRSQGYGRQHDRTVKMSQTQHRNPGWSRSVPGLVVGHGSCSGCAPCRPDRVHCGMAPVVAAARRRGLVSGGR
jgi:hypothetical protein